MKNQGVKHIRVLKLNGGEVSSESDALAREEPLEISLSIPNANPPIQSKNISVTMRTPGADADLALGFLFTEGILMSFSQVSEILISENAVDVVLKNDQEVDLSKLDRHFYTSSSCGVCGKASIEMIQTQARIQKTNADFKVTAKLIHSLPAELLKKQQLFESTGGLHAAALFSSDGVFEGLCEDVGRHNALDKLLGQALQKEKIPLNNQLLLLSGRASFELIQKAIMAGLHFIMAVGAPSSLALELAQEHNLTLIGFLKADRFNVYNDVGRIEF